MRNPWRFSFDTATGDLWVGRRRAGRVEEINRLPADGGFDAGKGDNLGWDEMEGTHPFDGGENPDGAVLPIFEYGRDQGCSVTRWLRVPRRGDPRRSRARTSTPTTAAPACAGSRSTASTVIDTRRWDLPVEEAYSFGQDDDGELYVLLGGGRVVKLVTP